MPHLRLILAVLLQSPPIVPNSIPLLISSPLPLELGAKYPLPRAAGNGKVGGQGEHVLDSSQSPHEDWREKGRVKVQLLKWLG